VAHKTFDWGAGERLGNFLYEIPSFHFPEKRVKWGNAGTAFTYMGRGKFSENGSIELGEHQENPFAGLIQGIHRQENFKTL